MAIEEARRKLRYASAFMNLKSKFKHKDNGKIAGKPLYKTSLKFFGPMIRKFLEKFFKVFLLTPISLLHEKQLHFKF